MGGTARCVLDPVFNGRAVFFSKELDLRNLEYVTVIETFKDYLKKLEAKTNDEFTEFRLSWLVKVKDIGIRTFLIISVFEEEMKRIVS